MVYYAANSVAPASVAGGPVNYENPYYRTQCGCGSGRRQVTMQPNNVREGFNVNGGYQANQHNGNGHQGDVPANGMPMPPVVQAGSGSAPLCTLTATAPPAGCCHPAPLHCDCCAGGKGFFRASEAYGS